MPLNPTRFHMGNICNLGALRSFARLLAHLRTFVNPMFRCLLPPFESGGSGDFGSGSDFLSPPYCSNVIGPSSFLCPQNSGCFSRFSEGRDDSLSQLPYPCAFIRVTSRRRFTAGPGRSSKRSQAAQFVAEEFRARPGNEPASQFHSDEGTLASCIAR